MSLISASANDRVTIEHDSFGKFFKLKSGQLHIDPKEGRLGLDAEGELIEFSGEQFKISIVNDGEYMNLSRRGGGPKLLGNSLIFIFETDNGPYKVNIKDDQQSLHLASLITGNSQIQGEKMRFWGTGHLLLAFLVSFIGAGIGSYLLGEIGLVIGFLITIMVFLGQLEKRGKTGVIGFTKRTGIPPSVNLQKKLN